MNETPEPTTWSIYTIYDEAGSFLGRTQAKSPEGALAKWERLYGERGATARVEG